MAWSDVLPWSDADLVRFVRRLTVLGSFDSDKIGQGKSARRKGGNENCMPFGTFTFTIFDVEAG